MKIISQKDQHGIIAGRETENKLIDGLTAAGFDYRDYDVKSVARSIDEAYEIARLTQQDGFDGYEFLLDDGYAIEQLNALAFSESAPDLLDLGVVIDFGLPTL